MENEKQLDVIDRKALLKTLDRYINPMPNESGYEFLRGIATAITEIEDSPAVDAVEVVHGAWEPCAIQPNGFVGSYRCTACGNASINDSNYCPNCGAKMKGENEDGNL